MQVISMNEYDNDERYTKMYKLANSIQIDSIMNIIKEYENENIQMSVCYCSSFDDDGLPLHKSYNNVDEMIEINNFPSSYISFSIDFCNRNTGEYCYSLLANTNSNMLSYVVDKNKRREQNNPLHN